MRRNPHSSDAKSTALRKVAQVTLAGFVPAVRPGKEPVGQLSQEKLKPIKKCTPYALAPSLLQDTVVIFPAKRLSSQTFHENE